MKLLISFAVFISFFSILFYNGCKDTITAADINSVVIPSSNVSYSKYIQPVLSVYCATSGCHDGTGGGGGLNFTYYGGVIASYAVVAPGHPETSQLVWVMEGKPGFKHVFQAYYSPNTNQIKGVETWITEGAKDN
jgi:hypothetical protein